MKSKYNSAATFFLILTLIFAVLIGTADAQPGRAFTRFEVRELWMEFGFQS